MRTLLETLWGSPSRFVYPVPGGQRHCQVWRPRTGRISNALTLVHILLDSETTDSKATSAQVADVGPQAKLLSRQWDKLVLSNGVLFRTIQDTVSSISTYSAQCHRATAFKGLHSDVGHVWTDSTGPKCSCLLGTNAVLVRRVFEGRPRLQRQQGELQSLQGDRWSYFVWLVEKAEKKAAANRRNYDATDVLDRIVRHRWGGKLANNWEDRVYVVVIQCGNRTTCQCVRWSPRGPETRSRQMGLLV